MKELLIIGARGFGREVYHTATKSHGFGTKWIIKGFLDSDNQALSSHVGFPPIISSVEDYIVLPNDIFCCALGSVADKKKYASIILEKKGVFTNIIHKDTQLFESYDSCKGLIVSSYTVLSCGLKLGDFVTFQNYVMVGHDAEIGSWCHFNSQSFVGGYAIIEDESTLHVGAKVLPKKRVGAKSTVGAGSVVVKDVPQSVTVFGVPAKILPSNLHR